MKHLINILCFLYIIIGFRFFSTAILYILSYDSLWLNSLLVLSFGASIILALFRLADALVNYLLSEKNT